MCGCRFMAYECLRIGAEDLRILVSSEMVRVFSVSVSGVCTIVVETHLRYVCQSSMTLTPRARNMHHVTFKSLPVGHLIPGLRG